ncbi:zinc-binding alcohol dehydrogenase family protein [Curtobacterium sp. PhB115]|uniref:zinc-binding alcohol dehydrogenase family protein n=1 Tax=Curtobacterium sp. PhB115 TaxID=2485173 RepID=UPI000F91801F|nr:zinc-binding alcohol dehydrogenase family protein [Curtobacterium sp. PhB115]ROP58680.1 propanol-preferring alcohol dehydrogenase [Curtobacterium sp. PhB115]
MSEASGATMRETPETKMAGVPETMRAWVTEDEPGSLRLRTDEPTPRPLGDEVLVRVDACGLCRTDLHVIDRELPQHLEHVVPGHQIVGTVLQRGADAHRFAVGDRIGVAWLRRTCGRCGPCRSGAENLCQRSQYTGWDANGGFAEYAVVSQAFAYRLRSAIDPVRTAPLLCAGIIGYRALNRAALPDGGLLGIFGYGSSAGITAQIAHARGARVAVSTRGTGNRDRARDAGAVFVGDATAAMPEPLDSAIVFAPAGDLVPLALRATRPGGTVVLAGIHMTDLPSIRYEFLFGERDLRTVTANTRADGEALFRLAATLELRPAVTEMTFNRIAEAANGLRSGALSGSVVFAGWD